MQCVVFGHPFRVWEAGWLVFVKSEKFRRPRDGFKLKIASASFVISSCRFGKLLTSFQN